MTGGEYYDAMVEAVRGRGNFFKATCEDGTAFADSSFRYVVGETATAKGAGTRLCARGLLHFADVPAETLVGGSWPCRLFEVAPGKIIARNGFKCGAKSLIVVRELPAWLALGPNGRGVAQFLTELAVLGRSTRAADRVAALVAALVAARNASRVAALAAAGAAAWDADRDAAGDAAGALVVADLITPKQLATLYAPFAARLPLEALRERAIAAFPLTLQP